MKTFVNGKKIPIIPPLLVNNNHIILPTNQIFYIQNRLTDFDMDFGKILQLINRLNSHKAHGHDRISIQMVKLCNVTITKSLSIIYKNCLQQGVFPNEWKKR